MKPLKSRIDKDEYTSVHEMADAIVKDITAFEDELVQPKQKTFQDVINFENKLEVQLLHIYGTIDGVEPPVTDGQKQRVRDLTDEFNNVMGATGDIQDSLNELMALIRSEKVPFIAPKKKN